MIHETVNDFALPSTGDKIFRLSEHKEKIVVLYFYPKDSSPGCTTESQQFRDRFPEFIKADSIIVGVSRDGLRSHENFKTRQKLPFDLLSDGDEKLCTQFSVMKEKKLYGKQVRGIERSTFVIDKAGVLQREWRGVKIPDHAEEVLDFVRTL